TTPVGCPPPTPPQLTAPGPASTTAAPTRPPTSAWLELEGSPHRQVSRFQVTAAVRAAPTTITVWPSRLQTAARMIAARGLAPLVATSVAMALAASWKPLVNANPKMATTASTNAASTLGHPSSPRGADHSPTTSQLNSPPSGPVGGQAAPVTGQLAIGPDRAHQRDRQADASAPWHRGGAGSPARRHGRRRPTRSPGRGRRSALHWPA